MVIWYERGDQLVERVDGRIRFEVDGGGLVGE